jgi:hypothetical protein
LFSVKTRRLELSKSVVIHDLRATMAFKEARFWTNVSCPFVTQTAYVNAAYTTLKKTYPNGQVTGIQTRYSTSHGFLSWRNLVTMKGDCTKPIVSHFSGDSGWDYALD